MADSQSLVLLPPQPAAAPDSTQSLKKTVKPTQDKSFGQKLDKAKKQITAKTSDPKPVPAPVKKLPVAQDSSDKTTDSADASNAQPVQASIDPTPQKPVAKVAKPVVKDVSDEEDAVATEKEPKASAEKTVAPQPIKPAAPTKAAAEKPKKAVKVADAKVTDPKIDQTHNAVVANQTGVKNSTDAASTTENASTEKATASNTAQTASLSRVVDSSGATDAADSDDSAVTGNNALFGSGKVVGRGNPGDAASSIVDSVADATVNQNEGGEAASQLDPVTTAAAEIAPVEDASAEKISATTTGHTSVSATDVAGLGTSTSAHAPTALAGKTAAATHEASPQVRFAEDNHPKIVTSIAGQLLPKGGTMQLQLNPADLGALQVTVHIQDGVVTASFETSNDDATKLLSHSLGQLKQGLEAAGVSVEKLHVERAPQQDSKNDSESDSKQPMQEQQKQAQQDQQRREMVQRMWRRLAGGADPLDLVA